MRRPTPRSTLFPYTTLFRSNFAHAITYPAAPGIGIATRKFHRHNIILSQRRAHVEHARFDIHPVLGARLIEKICRCFVAETARSEVHSDPDAIEFIDRKST